MSAVAPQRFRRPPPAGLATIIVLALVVVVWQAATTLLGVSANVLPSPLRIATAADLALVAVAAVSTTAATVAGFVVGNVVGFVLAVLVTSSRTFSDIVYPIAVVVRAVPIVALAPFITLTFGRGPGATIVVAALIVFFPTLVNVIFGLRSVPAETLELLRVMNARPVFGYIAVRIPYATPAFVSALKISAPNAVLGVLTAEWIIGGTGLGRLVIQSWLGLDLATMWAAVLVSAAVAALLFSAVTLVERLALGWAVRT